MLRLSALLPACLLAVGLDAAAASAPPRQKVNPPPNAELQYTIKARQKGLSLEGEAVARWEASSGRFTASSQARAALLGKILDTRSEGTIGPNGLVPASFEEKRLRRPAQTTVFDQGARTVRFGENGATLPLKGGEQDRNTVLWQLISTARATPAKAKAGSQWTFTVAGRRDLDPWTFKAVGQEKIATGAGEMATLHVVRMPEPGSKDQQLDIWLAPGLEWYPVRLRYSEDDGDFIEQTLQQVKR
ncbi:hypothetical protein NCCP691_08360 [Noviherbaspirillum aridicola]|uniref:DUF3108 domain-containing protein n=2 Tax=Noviherbaspirillum aridicola TaxID=2849687 RepID=A0ABQ4Q186_9BURK|nr:hypothetical protein NCCP691_08360 [Noviherbaspirillum aridicola]